MLAKQAPQRRNVTGMNGADNRNGHRIFGAEGGHDAAFR
jgi:hypothetical protein